MTIPFLEHQCDQQCIALPIGAPIGFDTTEQWIRLICDQMGTDPTPALQKIKKQRLQAHGFLNRFNALTGLPKGASFGIEGDASLALPLAQWLHSYLGMVPLGVQITDGTSEKRAMLSKYLDDIGCGEAVHQNIANCTPEVVFGSDALISRLKLQSQQIIGIETALPTNGYQHIIPKKTMGASGALYLIEMIINGLSGW